MAYKQNEFSDCLPKKKQMTLYGVFAPKPKKKIYKKPGCPYYDTFDVEGESDSSISFSYSDEQNGEDSICFSSASSQEVVESDFVLSYPDGGMKSNDLIKDDCDSQSEGNLGIIQKKRHAPKARTKEEIEFGLSLKDFPRFVEEKPKRKRKTKKVIPIDPKNDISKYFGKLKGKGKDDKKKKKVEKLIEEVKSEDEFCHSNENGSSSLLKESQSENEVICSGKGNLNINIPCIRRRVDMSGPGTWSIEQIEHKYYLIFKAQSQEKVSGKFEISENLAASQNMCTIKFLSTNGENDRLCRYQLSFFTLAECERCWESFQQFLPN
ncbi:hypothetical protein TRFO_33327 [Tritrichomonas foetus]|uniref:Uncharacterized protein n=1 Tax=Tritrichomonas foetus TaxID=1144522 RepID=A0A1J4JS25_9EUKA|nr:hypothetical protein TRFO_33327 [Tritrichomonas foetus]|eukprot:OHT00045.1 hypothetical protein TRFO_33327 [Tritrichomonas foetus]